MIKEEKNDQLSGFEQQNKRTNQTTRNYSNHIKTLMGQLRHW